jgi:hypothetical protein
MTAAVARKNAERMWKKSRAWYKAAAILPAQQADQAVA